MSSSHLIRIYRLGSLAPNPYLHLSQQHLHGGPVATPRPHSVASYTHVAPGASPHGSEFGDEQIEGVSASSRRRHHPRRRLQRAEGEPMVPLSVSSSSNAARAASAFMSSLGSSFRRSLTHFLVRPEWQRTRSWLGWTAGVMCMVVITQDERNQAAASGGDAASVLARQAAAFAAASNAIPLSSSSSVPPSSAAYSHPHAQPQLPLRAAPIPPSAENERPKSGAIPIPDEWKAFLPHLGKFEPAAPAVEFGVAAVAGYATGYLARVFTRVGVFMIGVSAFGLYLLQKQGVIEIKTERLKTIGRKIFNSENQQRVEDVINKNPDIWSKIGDIIETLTTTVHGVGFSAGFLFAFK